MKRILNVNVCLRGISQIGRKNYQKEKLSEITWKQYVTQGNSFDNHIQPAVFSLLRSTQFTRQFVKRITRYFFVDYTIEASHVRLALSTSLVAHMNSRDKNTIEKLFKYKSQITFLQLCVLRSVHLWYSDIVISAQVLWLLCFLWEW